MTNEEIKATKATLKKISELPKENRFPELHKIAKTIGCFYLTDSGTDSQTLFLNIHTYLQSEMMFNACVFAKWSCFWAAVAAIVACIGVILTMCLN